MNILKPCLAAKKPKDWSYDKFFAHLHSLLPLVAEPKIDGIRCIMNESPKHPIHELLTLPHSRTLKLIPNAHIRSTLGKLNLPSGLDGELVTYTDGKLDDFNTIQSKVMSEDGEPDFIYIIFDWLQDVQRRYDERATALTELEKKIDSRLIATLDCHRRTLTKDLDLAQFICRIEQLETHYRAAGFGEGIMFRRPYLPYRTTKSNINRSTLKEGYLIALKRFEDSEGIIVGFTEGEHNLNLLGVDNFGSAKRSKSNDGLVGNCMLGAITVYDPRNKWTVNIGTGFTEQQRKDIWRYQSVYGGKTIKYKYQAHGMKDVPRQPVFLGFRKDGE